MLDLASLSCLLLLNSNNNDVVSYKSTFEENENIESELRYRFPMLRCCSYLIVLGCK